MKLDSNIKKGILLLNMVVVVHLISQQVYKRFDLTQDQRYTVSQEAKSIIAPIDAPLIIEVLLDGNLPSEFKKLQRETKPLRRGNH